MRHLSRLPTGRTGTVLAALATLVVATACGDGEIDLPELAKRAEEVRELGFLSDVDVVVMTREEFASQQAAAADAIDEAELVEFAETWGRLGYFPLDIDLRPILAGSYDWVGASYSARRKRITLIGEVEDYVLVHEYVHALQDQNFDLTGYDGSTSDSFLARRAVVEGDAVLAEGRFVVEQIFDSRLEFVDWEQLLDERRRGAQEFLSAAEYPVFFLDYPSFVYTYGLEYTADNLMGVNIDHLQPDPPPYDWGREDELFTERPPASTQQVLRRDDGVDPVEEVGLDSVPTEQAERLETIDWDTLGEWYTYLLFYPLDGLIDVRALAAGWDGDRVLFARDLTTNARATVWASAWDDDTSATRVLAALTTLYAVEPVPGAALELGMALDGEPVWLEQRGNRLVATKNLDPELAPAIADAAFGPAAERRAARRRQPLGLRRRELID